MSRIEAGAIVAKTVEYIKDAIPKEVGVYHEDSPAVASQRLSFLLRPIGVTTVLMPDERVTLHGAEYVVATANKAMDDLLRFIDTENERRLRAQLHATRTNQGEIPR